MLKQEHQYKTKYGETTNINEETDIYKLKLQNDKKYIGKTTNIDRRMNQHFSGNGAKVTQKFKPIEGEVIDSCPGFFADKLEQIHTEENIDKYGYENVRGGKYTNSTTLKKTKQPETCFRCGRKGHYITNCYAKTHINGKSLV